MNDQGPSLVSAPQQADPPTQPFIQSMPPNGAEPAIDAFDQLAPEIPGLDAPDASFVLTPGTAAQLARHNALRAAPRFIGIFLAIAVPTSTIALLWVGLPWTSLLAFQGVVVVYVLVVTYFSLRRQFRSLSRSDVSTSSCALTLGADALDLAEGSSRTRIGYERIRAVSATRHIVTLSFDNRHVALPRPLFPDALLARLHRLVDHELTTRPSALPPFPRLPHPQVHTVIAADTAHRLTVARRLEPWRGAWAPFAIALLLAEAGAIGGLAYGVPGALTALLSASLGALTIRFWMRRPSQNALRQYQGMLPVASGLAAQFGTDAVVLAGSTLMLRAPYSLVAKVVLRAECAVVNYGTSPMILPRALFPSEVLPRLRERGVTVVER